MLLPKGGVTWKSTRARLPPSRAVVHFFTKSRFLLVLALVAIVIVLWRGIASSASEMQRYGVYWEHLPVYAEAKILVRLHPGSTAGALRRLQARCRRMSRPNGTLIYKRLSCSTTIRPYPSIPHQYSTSTSTTSCRPLAQRSMKRESLSLPLLKTPRLTSANISTFSAS